MPIVFIALLLTISVEFLVYAVIFRKRILLLLLYSVLINCLTQPAAYFLYKEVLPTAVYDTPFNIYFLITEIIVFLAEVVLILLLFRVNLKKAVWVSFAANLITALLSFVV